jgi:hypothetical protein
MQYLRARMRACIDACTRLRVCARRASNRTLPRVRLNDATFPSAETAALSADATGSNA